MGANNVEEASLAAAAMPPAQISTVHAGPGPMEADKQQKEAAECHQAIVARACRKLNRLMLPFALLFSIIASLDRANLSFASISMSKELGLTAMDYGLGSAIFFISYAVFQVPSNVAFIYAGGPLMLGLIAVAWGLVASSMAAVHNTATFLTVRFLLGIAEAGTVPGIWAYLSSMYPPEHLTLPTTFYMAGITAAQALGAPLAAGLLTIHGAGNLSGWQYLFIIEGAPAVFLGVAIFLFLPKSVSGVSGRILTPLERQHLQAAVDGTIPPPCPTTPKTAVLASDLSSSSSSSGGSSSSSSGSSSRSDDGSTAVKDVTPASAAAAAAEPRHTPAHRVSSRGVLAVGMRHSRLDGKPSFEELCADFVAAARHRVVWCSSFWRFLYLLTLNGLIFWVPLIVHALLDVPSADNAAHTESAHMTNDTRILLLAAVPYVAGVATHVVNALHSHRLNERRWHIAIPWFIGGALMLVLPFAWMRQADEVSYTLLVLASMGIMGCDGIDVSWIISLMASLTPSQTVLALAMINMFANFGGFVGNYLIGALKQASGNYYAGIWMLGGIMVLAACLVSLFPMEWALPATDSEGGGASASSKEEDCCSSPGLKDPCDAAAAVCDTAAKSDAGRGGGDDASKGTERV